MCAHGDTVDMMVRVPARLSHTGEERNAIKSIDRCIAPVVAGLNAAGVLTANSCCGHGRAPGGIILHDGRKLVVFWADDQVNWGDPVQRLRANGCDLVDTADASERCSTHQQSGGDCLAELDGSCPT